jgi:hypothetical protein
MSKSNTQQRTPVRYLAMFVALVRALNTLFQTLQTTFKLLHGLGW